MNLQGFTAPQLGQILNHVTRHEFDPDQTKYRYGNQNIDKARTADNYVIGGVPDPAAFIAERVASVDRKPRRNSKILSSIVVTLPRNPRLEGREREFFEACAKWLMRRVGRENVVGGFVHVDENQPHMHFCFTPVFKTPVTENDKTRPLLDKSGNQKRDKRGVPLWERKPKLGEDGQPIFKTAFAQSKLFDRAALDRLHPELESALHGRFGFKTGIRLESPGERQLSRLDQKDYRAAKTQLAETRAELERERARVDEAREAVEQAAEAVTAAQAFAAKAKGLLTDVAEFLRSHGLGEFYKKWLARRHPDAPTAERATRDLDRAADRLRDTAKSLGRAR